MYMCVFLFVYVSEKSKLFPSLKTSQKSKLPRVPVFSSDEDMFDSPERPRDANPVATATGIETEDVLERPAYDRAANQTRKGVRDKRECSKYDKRALKDKTFSYNDTYSSEMGAAANDVDCDKGSSLPNKRGDMTYDVDRHANKICNKTYVVPRGLHASRTADRHEIETNSDDVIAINDDDINEEVLDLTGDISSPDISETEFEAMFDGTTSQSQDQRAQQHETFIKKPVSTSNRVSDFSTFIVRSGDTTSNAAQNGSAETEWLSTSNYDYTNSSRVKSSTANNTVSDSTTSIRTNRKRKSKEDHHRGEDPPFTISSAGVMSSSAGDRFNLPAPCSNGDDSNRRHGFTRLSRHNDREEDEGESLLSRLSSRYATNTVGTSESTRNPFRIESKKKRDQPQEDNPSPDGTGGSSNVPMATRSKRFFPSLSNLHAPQSATG